MEGDIEPKSAWDLDIVGGDLLLLGISSIVYLVLLFVVEFLKTKKINCLEPKVPWKAKAMDEDVEDERDRIEATQEDMAIKVKGIRKVYRGKKPKVAVDKISLGVSAGECFALLGINGAGKTTLFKMLTGEIVPSEGSITISNFNVPGQFNQARNYIGYCPQFDALIDNLTAREHLELYCALKGIPVHRREELIHKQLLELNLKKFEHVCAGTFSGGNKRKLSVAIALLGSPPIIFLDEPSNGMDPEAKRFMWNVISKISTNKQNSAEKPSSSVILTTHSMEEAEALSTKLAIQVDGNLKCIGSSQHIKSRYGGGYEIELKLEFPTKEEVKKALELHGLNASSRVKTLPEIQTLFEKFDIPDLFYEVRENGVAEAIWIEIKKAPVEASVVVEWALIEKTGKKMLDKLGLEFDELKITEHFQSFYRVKIASSVSIGKVFGFIEEYKFDLKVVQYSIRQNSIEQIFNAFANNVLPVKTKKPEIYKLD